MPPEDKVLGPATSSSTATIRAGCFKDRVLGTRAPHQLIEGLLIAAYAISSKRAFIFIRGEYAVQYKILETAIKEARAAGLFGDCDVSLMRGAGAYISGLDTALLETMEGKKAWPRQPPPFPTVAGLMGKPTVVNNVETLSMLPHIILNGGDWFAKIGVPGDPAKKFNPSGGTGVYSISGDIERPGVYEFPMGTPLKDMIAEAGGVKGGRKLKCIIPGGTSTPPLTAEEASVHGLTARAWAPSSGPAVRHLDETRDMAEVAHNIERFRPIVLRPVHPCRSGGGGPSAS